MTKQPGPKVQKAVKRAFKRRTIAVICGRVGSVFISGVIRGIEDRVKALGGEKYELAYHSARSGTVESASQAVEDILGQESADGIIILSMSPDEKTITRIRKARVPSVLIERRVEGLHSVNIDNFQGGFKAGGLLLKSGRRKIGAILDPQVKDKDSASRQRFEGFKKALLKGGIKFNNKNTTAIDFHTVECGRAAFDRNPGLSERVDGIFSVAGDLAAIGFMIEAKSQGIKIPRELAIVGFDDVEMASAVEPGLTTISQPINMMGSSSVDIIHRALENIQSQPENLVLETNVVTRGTV